MSYDTEDVEEKEGWRLKDQPKSRGLTRVVAFSRLLFQAVFSFLSPMHNHTLGPTCNEHPFFHNAKYNTRGAYHD